MILRSGWLAIRYPQCLENPRTLLVVTTQIARPIASSLMHPSKVLLIYRERQGRGDGESHYEQK
jgi:hypothetical protein